MQSTHENTDAINASLWDGVRTVLLSKGLYLYLCTAFSTGTVICVECSSRM